MKSYQSMSVALGLAALTLFSAASTAIAGPGPRGDNRSYSNITGTNIWNSTAPIIDDDLPIDPDLIAAVNRLNADAAARYTECLSAIAAAEQNVPAVPPRQYLRRDPRVPYPQACVELENLRTEAEGLKAKIQAVRDAAAESSAGTW